jgi:SAM-dependent methyltransferase
MNACAICGNTAGNRDFVAREMMFGFRDTFPYFECSACGCLQIAGIPADLAKYYPAGYYSFGKVPVAPRRPLASFIARQRARQCLGGAGRIWGRFSKRYGSYEWFRKPGVGLDSRILDVGCGSGRRLLEMAAEGFTRLTGQDLFIAETLDYGNGVRILKAGLRELTGEYDLIMLHHSFEHMPAPAAVLGELRRLLAPGGTVLIRVPVAADAWRQYGMDWVGVDAPRHFFLHTVKSMRVLTERAGFETADVVFDSGALQFWASELIRRDLPLYESTPRGLRSRRHDFTRREMRTFKRRAAELNRLGKGDAACFYLRKKTSGGT